MSSALDAFRQHQQALAEANQQAAQLASAIASITSALDAIARHDALRDILVQEQRWLERTESAVHTVATWRAAEAQHLWPWMIRRWLVAAAFAVAAAGAAGADWAWVVRPYADENTYLRARNGFAAALERRMLTMAPNERQQLEALLRPAPRAK